MKTVHMFCVQRFCMCQCLLSILYQDLFKQSCLILFVIKNMYMSGKCIISQRQLFVALVVFSRSRVGGHATSVVDWMCGACNVFD